MKLYRCLMLGENFPGFLLGEAEPIGFYTTRFVEAEDVEEAQRLALDLLRQDASLNVPAERRTKNARIHFEQIEEVPADTERTPNRGFTFFVMGT
ncbi:hypothetical protein ACFJGW_05305 [Burkholderiaceae bacterium UC74_6]